MKRILFCLFVAIAAIVFAACTTTVNLLDENKLHDTSLLSGEPCPAPCWNHIIPGETSYRDAKVLIEDDGRFGGFEEIESEEENDPARGFRFAPAEQQICCQIVTFDGEMVHQIVLQLAPQMTLGQALEQHGEPVYLTGDAPSEDQASMALVWPDLPMVIFAFVAGAEGELSASSQVFMALYMTEAEMQSLIDSARLYVWEGYQPYAAYVDGDYDFIGENAPPEGEGN